MRLILRQNHLLNLNGVGWLSLAVICFVHTVIMHYAYFESLGKLTGQEVAILGYIDPLVAVLISYFVFHESLTITQGVGGVMILGFALWNEVTQSAS
ncbi:MAG: DMT family transporter [Anaerovibrio sp.]|nr:DMT family transporter [Anaerovibrio sp.]